MIIRNIVFAFLITFSSVTVAMDQPENFQKQDDAARVLQRYVREHQNFESMYTQGLAYRDGKVKGYEKDSIFSKSPAGFHFFPLAWAGVDKAQHNLGMTYYAQGNYERAYSWLKKASDQGLAASIKNLKILTEEMSRALLRLPHVTLNCILSYLDNNSLLILRKTGFSAAEFVDQEFSSRAQIKMPLACLTSDVRPHPFPNTASFFLRKRLWQIPGAKPENVKQRAPIFNKCLEFSKDWKYPGMGLFNYATHLNNKENTSFGGTLSITLYFVNPTHMDDRDTRELNLYQFSHSATNEVPHPTQTLESFLAGASRMIDLREGEIAIYYLMNYARYSLIHSLEIKNYTTPILCFKKAADAGDVEALYLYSRLLREEIKIEKDVEKNKEKEKEILESLKKSADKGNKDAQYDFAVTLGLTEEAKRYYKMSADQGHPAAIHNLAYILKMEREGK